jgi:outer membrane protein OmpA-like peptidoglycan-associated protein
MPVEDSSIRHLRFGAALGLGLLRYDATFGSDCEAFDRASASGLSAELLFERPLSNTSPFWFSPRLRFLDLSARFPGHRDTNEVSILNQDSTRRSIFVVRERRFDASLFGIGAAAGILWEFLPGMRVGGDLSLIYLTQRKQRQSLAIIEPQNVSLGETGVKERTITDGTFVQFNPFAVDVGLSLDWMFQINERFLLHPSVRGNLLLTSLAKDVDWRGNSLLFTLGFAYDAASQPLDTAPIPESPRPPSRPYLAATIAARGIDREGREYANPVVEIEESPWSESIPMIPYVFFERGSDRIPARYMQLESREEADRFSIDSLLRVSPLDIHWQILNIIGMRLREHPEVTATITGASSSDEPDAGGLATARASAIRRYLSVIWGIDSMRISVASSPPEALSSEPGEAGREENRRGELSFSSDVISRPVLVTRLARIASPPAIRFFPEIVADSAVTDWNITIFQGEKELLKFEGSNRRGSLEQNRLWSLTDLRVHRDLSRIGYRLEVRDITGQQTSAEGYFQVMERKIRKEDTLMGSRQTLEFDLVGFDYNSAALLPRHSGTLSDAANAIDEGVQVRIEGFTDRVGDPERNRQLALERGKVAAEELRSLLDDLHRPAPASVSVEGFGGEEPPFNNNLPEGRILSRMVQITISRRSP